MTVLLAPNLLKTTIGQKTKVLQLTTVNIVVLDLDTQ